MTTLLNTRPSFKADELNQLLQENGLNSINFPTLTIEPIPFPQQKMPGGGVFFVSVHAVILFLAQLKSPVDYFKNATVYAIGKATQQQLKKVGVKSFTPVPPFNSQSVLKLLPDSLDGVNCLIVKGKGGLDELSTGLKSKKATVTEVECYQRINKHFCKASWLKFTQCKNGIILATSVESITAMIEQVDADEKKELLGKEAIVFSDRIATEMVQLGWQGKIHQTKEQTNNEIVSVLKRIDKEYQHD